MLVAIITGESATTLCLSNVTLRMDSDSSETKSQTSFCLSRVLFTPSTRIVGFSGCLSHLIASKIAQKETMHHLGIIWSEKIVIPNGQNLLTDACFKRRASAVLSCLNFSTTQHDCSMTWFQTSNLTQLNKITVAENKTKK